jgi:hypothetical protein
VLEGSGVVLSALIEKTRDALPGLWPTNLTNRCDKGYLIRSVILLTLLCAAYNGKRMQALLALTLISGAWRFDTQ